MDSQNENIQVKLEPKDDESTISTEINNHQNDENIQVKVEQPQDEESKESIQQEIKKEEEEPQQQQPQPQQQQQQQPKTLSPTIISPNTSSPTTSVTTQEKQQTVTSIINQPKKTIQIEILENRINIDVYDTEAWTLLLGEIQSQPIENCRAIYERFLSHFPTAGKYWKVYAEQEMLGKNYEAVEKIFFRSLRNVRNVELWKTYITYIRQHKSQNNRDEIIKAFEFALEFIGMDISSTPIWVEYLTFLKEEKTTSPFEEGQKMTGIRKLYQRAIENPMHDLDLIWKEYDHFENSINKILAKSLLTEHHLKYQHAKSIYRERKSLLEGILRNMLAKPPGSSEKEEHQVRLWRKLLAYEKKNPQKFEQSILRNRIASTYNQCLLCLYHYPDIWYEAAVYQAETGSLDGSNQFFERGIQALPKSLFLHFAYADSLESQKKLPQAKELYEKLTTTTATITTPPQQGSTNIPPSPVDPLVWIQYMRFARRTERIEGPRKIFKRAKASPDCSYHVYIALGLIEYYVNQDPKMARDIFELGLKKFPNESPFITFYIDFLTILNEENNTRVLFEKILLLPNHEKSTIDGFWRKYLDFEYRQNQDIQSIAKLEKRYISSFYSTSINPIDKAGVLQALNRYRFLNLSPCHPTEIEVINKNLIQSDQDDQKENGQNDNTSGGDRNSGKDHSHKDNKMKKHKKDKNQQSNLDSNNIIGGSSGSGSNLTLQENPEKPTSSTMIPTSNWKVKRPDVTTMQPYRGELGKFNSGIGGGSGAGGVNPTLNSPLSGRPSFDIPDFLYPLLQILPPSSSFNGPFIDIDFLLMSIKESNLPIINPNQQQQQQQNNPSTQSPPTTNIISSPNNISPPSLTPITTQSNILPQQQPPQQQQIPQQPQQQQLSNPLKRKLEDDDQLLQQPTQIPQQPQSQSYTFQNNTKPPSNDVYRKRQASKLSKKS